MTSQIEVRSKFLALKGGLNAQFLERGAVINGLLMALVARQHVLLLGVPGTAKSALGNALCGALKGAEYFQWLLTRYSTPEEIYGPVALSALKLDKYKRVTTNKLPECHVAFLDEIFKANSAILNTMLTAVNERKFHNNGGAVSIPLEMVIGASNELPESEELGALYDRFLLRFWVESLQSDDNFTELLMATEPGTLSVSITLDELHQAQAEAAAIPVSRAVAEELATMRREIGAAGLPQASDRRWRAAVTLLRAEAWLAGDAQVGSDHFGVLADALWSDPDQRDEVRKIVMKHCASGVAEGRAIYDGIADLIARLPQSGDARKAALASVAMEARRAGTALTALFDTAATAGSRDALAGLLADMETMLAPVKAEARKALGLG